MAGILWGEDKRVGVEASGVFHGVLQEDMIETVKRVKKPFIDVYMKDLFFEDANYPLTYVPMFNMVLPLKKGQEVWVQFNQENHRYPVLWKLFEDLGEGYTGGKFELPGDGDLVTFPDVKDTTEVVKISDDMWFICTASYGVLHWGSQCILLNEDSIVTNSSSFKLLTDNLIAEMKETAKIFAANGLVVGVDDHSCIKFSSSKAESFGTVVPKTSGILCSIPTCPFTGAPHLG